jgi:hypothetical protein
LPVSTVDSDFGGSGGACCLACTNDASSLAVGLSTFAVEAPVEIPLASVPFLVQ